MVDKNLFLYDLAAVAIFKDEARYLKEWLDYHLLAGVEHFYLYNNDSSDEYKEVLAPYIEKNLVTLKNFPGKMMQYVAYEDAINKYRFECRYIAFIDIDEFIFPKSNCSIVEVVDETLSENPNAAGLAINWQIFGSNGHKKADYSRGVLERFTRRASKDFSFFDPNGTRSGTTYIKSIVNPRFIQYMYSPHHAIYFHKKFAVNSSGESISGFYNDPVLYDKIVVNHYCIKSYEEFLLKQKKGRPDKAPDIDSSYFYVNDHNEVFDDGILKYRDVRNENFSLESEEQRANRVTNALVRTLTRGCDSLDGKLETFLTCRALAGKFDIKIFSTAAEEYALAWIYRALNTDNVLTYADLQLFIEALPEIFSRPFPLVKDICQTSSSRILPALMNFAINHGMMEYRRNLQYLQRMLTV